MVKRVLIKTYIQAKRFVIIVVGFTVFFIGILMIVLPGPAILVIPLGLTLLATEFVWAKKLLAQFKETADDAPRKVRRFFTRVLSKVRRGRLFKKGERVALL